MLKVKLANAGLDFRSSRKSFFLFVFFFFKVYTGSEKQFIADASTAQGTHTKLELPETGSSTVPYRQKVDAHKPN